jgi:hypothetical protein
MITGLLVAGAITSTFAQATASPRRVAVDKINQQPVAASSVALESKTSSSLNLTSAQRTQIANLDRQVGTLQAERTKLWSEYRAIIARPNFDDNMAAAEAAPRMLRIVEINNQLAPLAAKQESQLSTILNSSQRTQLARMVATVKSGM